MGAPNQPCIDQSRIEDSGPHGHTSIFRVLKFWDGKRRYKRFQPTFTIDSDTQWVNDLSTSTQRRIKSTGLSSLKDFTDNSIGFVYRGNAYETMGLVPSLEFRRINTKSPNFFKCLNYHTQMMLSSYQKTNFLACPIRMGQASLHRLIQDLGQWIPCAYPSSNPKILSKFKRWKTKIPNILPNFQNSLQYTTR